jgi:hypothetical protein
MDDEQWLSTRKTEQSVPRNQNSRRVKGEDGLQPSTMVERQVTLEKYKTGSTISLLGHDTKLQRMLGSR